MDKLIELLEDLQERLVLNYNDGVPFEQYEEDRLAVSSALGLINRQNERLATFEARNKALRTERNHRCKKIKKLKAEIEQIKDANTILQEVYKKTQEKSKEIKAEAVKEFAERFKSYLHQNDFETPDERWKPESEFAK